MSHPIPNYDYSEQSRDESKREYTKRARKAGGDNYHGYLKKKGVKDTTFLDFARQVAHKDPVHKSKMRHEQKEFKINMGPGGASFRRYKKALESKKSK